MGSSRFEILSNFEKSMRILLKEKNSQNKEFFMKDMLVVLKYVSSIKEGVFLAQEIKTNFEVFLPKIEEEWKDSSYEPLLEVTERYTEKLASHLHTQQQLFEQVVLIISCLDINDESSLKTTIKSTLIPIAIEIKIINLLCHLHSILFRRDQEKLNEAIDDFLREFEQLEEAATKPLLQLRCVIEQLRVASNMPSEPKTIRLMLEKVVQIAENFILSFYVEE